MSEEYRSGFAAIIGKPNVGKSSFLNRAIEEKLAIITPKPQTTRDRILGIYNSPHSQVIFLDTPGIHASDKELNRCMMDKALATINDADLVIVMTDPHESLDGMHWVVSHLQNTGKTALLVLNKTDLLPDTAISPRLAELAQAYPFEEMLGISCLSGSGISALMAAIENRLPEGPPLFPDDALTDLSERFLASEIIREKVFLLTQQEIPYSTAVEIEQFKEGDPTYIAACIHIERPGQKSIVIGRGGAMLKQIGTEARLDIQRLLGVRVFLELFVRVTKDWTKNPRELKRLGYK